MKKIVFTLPAFLLFFIFSGCNNLGKEKTYNGVELYHTESVSDTLAGDLGKYLVTAKFADGNEKTVQLTKSGDTLHFRMVVQDGKDKDTSLDKTFKVFASSLSSDVFNSAPVALDVCDKQMKTLKTFMSADWGKLKTVNGVQLYHTKKVTDAEVDSLGNYLISSKFANGVPKTAQITKSGNTYQFRMVVKAGMEKDPEYLKNVKIFASDLSKNVFGGAPVELDLCDDYLSTLVAAQMD